MKEKLLEKSMMTIPGIHLPTHLTSTRKSTDGSQNILLVKKVKNLPLDA